MEPTNLLKKNLLDNINDFIDSCLPLKTLTDDNTLYFLSKTYDLYGFDCKKKLIFEPNSITKYNLVIDNMKLYFNDEAKNKIKNDFDIEFNTLLELVLKINYRDKHLGKKFFYSPSNNKIYIWSLISNDWKSEDLHLRYLFSNPEVFSEKENITVNNIQYKSLNDFNIIFEDLEEISKRMKDSSIHYLHKKQNEIYSLNIKTGSWYKPDINTKNQLLL